MASTSDLFTDTENGGPPEPTTASAARTSGATTLECEALTNWPTNTKVFFVTGTPTIDAEGSPIIDPTTLCLWFGIVSGSNLVDIELTGSPDDTDPGNNINDLVQMAPTSTFFHSMFDALTAEHDTEGIHLPSATEIYNPTGIVWPFAGSSAPSGWLLCQGQSVAQATYPALYAVIGTTYGSGAGGGDFSIPDLRGRTPIGSGAYTWAETFPASAVSTGASQITVSASPEWITGHTVVLTCTGTAPGGLTATDTYYVIVINSTTIQLASSLTNAVAGTAISLTTQGTGINTLTHTGTLAHTLGEIGGEDGHAIIPAEMPIHTHQLPNGGTGNTAANPGVYFNAQATNGTAGATGFTSNALGNAGSSNTHNNLQPYTTLNYIIKT